MAAEFFCNDLKVIGKKIYVRRAPFGAPNYKCGKIWHKYKKANWSYEETDQTCTGSGKKIYKMTSNS